MARVRVEWNAKEDCNPYDVRKGKMDFSRKGHFDAGGHTKEAQAAMAHSTYRMHIYMQSVKRRYGLLGGKEYSEDQEKVLVIVSALYGLRSAGASWRAALAELLLRLEYNLTEADPDVWICLAVTEFGMKYYEMLCVYLGGIVAVNGKARDAMQQVTEVFMAKEGSVGMPERYLDVDIEKIQVAEGRMI
eukprot:7963813-Ditylum_brightwellii.AAC.1